MAFTGPTEDKQHIRERFEFYSDAVTRRDLDDYLSCWTDDGRRTGAGGECAGKDELRAHWQTIFDTVEQMVFFTQLASLDVDGDTAVARSYCHEMLQLRDGTSTQLVGEYHDELVRIAGDWLFSARHYRVRMAL